MKKILRSIAEYFIKPSIVFESKPAFSDNTKAVYDEMVRQGYEKRYNLIWYISEDQCATLQNGNVIYWNPRDRKTIKEKIRNYSYYYKTKCIICCNTFIGASGSHQITNGKNQRSFYLSHGTPLKRVKEYYTSPGGIDYCLSAHPDLNTLMAEEFSFSPDQVFSGGFPRNDVFAKSFKSLKTLFHGDFNKVIIWYPTYRQNGNKSINLAGDSLPLIHNESNAEQLNEAARQNRVLIVIKPHFAQDISLIEKKELSNITFIDDSFFEKNEITSYEFLAGSDALITDYSSVYFDYTLHDRPIAVIWEDIEEYKQFPGFAMDLSYYMKGAEKIYSIDQLCEFVKDVACENDRLQAERREIRDKTNISTDGKNSERVVDFIVDKAKL